MGRALANAFTITIIRKVTATRLLVVTLTWFVSIVSSSLLLSCLLLVSKTAWPSVQVLQ